jgi:hypothetical protein
MTSASKFRVFLSTRYVHTRANTSKFRAEWVTRSPGSTAVYTSKACERLEDAKALAYKWLARNSDRYVDTTKEG